MKQHRFLLLLGAEALCAVILYLLPLSGLSVMTTIFAFPWELVGMGLRALSLSGSAGNAIALVLYIAICLLPSLFLLPCLWKRRFYPENAILLLISITLFFVLYWMVNPSMLPFVPGTEVVGKAVCGGVIASLFLAWIVLRILRRFGSSDKAGLARDLQYLLCFVCMIFIFVIFGANFGALLDSVNELHAGNHVNGQPASGLGMSYVFLVLRYIFDSLPFVLNLLICFSGRKLLQNVHTQSEQIAVSAARFSRLCICGLAVTVLSTACFNLLQLLFASQLRIIHTSVDLPVLSFAFVLAALLLSKYIQENKQLRDDNDLFI